MGHGNRRQIGPPLPRPRGKARSGPWCYSPEHHEIITMCDDPVVRRWDGATGEPIESPLRHPDRVLCMAFSPDGRTIPHRMRRTRWLGCGTRRIARQADRAALAASGLGVFRGVQPRRPGWLPHRVAGMGAEGWDAATGRPHRAEPSRHPSYVWTVAFSPDGRFLLTCDDAWRGGDQRRAATEDAAANWPPGSRPSPGWSWTSGARSARSTATPGKSGTVGWRSSAGRPHARPCHPPPRSCSMATSRRGGAMPSPSGVSGTGPRPPATRGRPATGPSTPRGGQTRPGPA